MSTATPEPQPDAQDEQFQKPRAGVYTVMLLVSFLALSIASFCLYKEMQAYDFDFTAKGAHYESAGDVPTLPPASQPGS